MVTKLAAVCTLQLFSGYQTELRLQLIYWVCHSFDSRGIIVWFLAGEFFFPPKCPRQFWFPPRAGGWPGMKQTDHSCPFTVVLRFSVCVCVCVCSWTFTPLHACMAHTGTTLQIPDCTENTELDTCLTHLLLSSVSKWQCFFFLELVAWLLHLSAGLYEPQ